MPIFSKLWSNAHILLFATTLMWAGHAIVLKISINEISPLLLMTLRWIGCTIFLSFFLKKSIKNNIFFFKKNIFWIFFMGGICLSGFTICLIIGAHNTSAINMGINQSFIPAMVVLIGWFFLNKRINKIQFLGLFLSILGVILLTLRGSLINILELNFNYGDLIMLLGCFFYAIYTLGISKKTSISPLTLFFFFSLCSSFSMIFSLIFEINAGKVIYPTLKSLIILTYIIIFPSILAQTFFIRGVTLIGSNMAGLYVNLVPVFTAILAVTLISEPFFWFHPISLILVLIGIFLSEKYK